MSDWPDEQTDDPLCGDDRNFYKVEAWSRDGNRTDALLYTGNNLRKPQEDLCYDRQAPAAHQADHPAADAGAGVVAGVGSIRAV